MANLSLCDQAYKYIYDRIIDFDYKPNDPIIENDLVRELGISRTPLREALRQLESNGLVYKVKNRGTYVRALTYEDVVESCEIRSIFELYAVKRCVEYVSDEEIDTLLDKLKSLNEDSPSEQYYECDVTLHKTIMKYCMNSKMVSYLDSLNIQLEVFRRMSAKNPNRLPKSRDEHIHILQFMKIRDIAPLSEALETHLENVKKSTLQVFQNWKMNIIE